MKSFIVYKYTAKHNGLIYIGITSKTLKTRWKQGYKGNPRLHNAIKKYGEDGFTKEILFENLSKEEACQKEIEAIAYYDSTNPEKGYNISLGGEAPMWNRHHSKETRKLFSETRKGKNNSFYGKKHDRANLGKNIPIICLNTLEKFPSLTLAAEAKTCQGCTGCTETNLSRTFYGQLTAGKTPEGEMLFWSRYDETKNDDYYIELFNDFCLKREERMKEIYATPKNTQNRVNKEVVDLLSGKIYKSAKDAEEKTRIYYGNIAQSCRGEKKTAGGKIFLYLKDYLSMNKEDKVNCLIDRWTGEENKPIVCLNNNCLYKTALDCAKFAGIKCGDTIADCANGLCDYSGIHEQTGQFLRWRYYEDYINLSKQEIQEILNKPILNHIPLHCITTNKYFRDASTAAKYYNLHISGLHKCCRGEYKTCGKYNGEKLEWEYDIKYRWNLYCTDKDMKTLYETNGLFLNNLFVNDEYTEENE